MDIEEKGGEETTEGATQEDTTNTEGNDETSSTQPDLSEESISAWEEDRLARDELARENLELRRKMAESSSSKEEGEDLSMDERVDREIKQREEFAKQQAEIDRQSAESEVRFLEKISPTFRENKEAILKLAVDVKAKTLKEAIDIFEKRKGEVNKPAKPQETEEKQKKTAIKTEKKSVEDMSIQDIYSTEL